MTSSILSMSSMSNQAVEPEIVASSMPKPERMLDGFPWMSAIILYTLSWGWSLIRPNTLYWEDWSVFDFRGVGLPPWTALMWPIISTLFDTFMIFAGYFITGIFLFVILTKFKQLDLFFKRATVLLFLIAPVNHARVAHLFHYSSSYFLFFLGWAIMVRSKKVWSFSLALVAIFLSFQAESLLFFVLLPFVNFLWLNKVKLFSGQRVRKYQMMTVCFAVLPVLYFVLKREFWQVEDTEYRSLSISGFVIGFIPIFIATVFLALVIFRFRKTKTVNIGIALASGGLWITALALFPYFFNGSIAGYRSRTAYVTVFEFRAAWRSRHLLLVPLGISLTIVGLNQLWNPKNRNYLLKFMLTSSVLLNMFFGSQYFLQSHKQEQLVALFKSTKDEIVIASVNDQTIRFMGRGSEFISDEWFGLMTLAEVPDEWLGLMDLVGVDIPDRPGCEALPSGSALILKSDTPYLKALVTRDLGLYFEVTPCSEVLAKDG